ncbi:hypothetical protein Mgra_00009126 [Meloidogyne graminicola]|uniref:DOMON domain-containing protein n=1 Tax=Meloidogyne graminicola TaxID=189291 RepID=A0A8S9ZDR3_9BILA|nr:hypothetical protein Mgra_00009126 [Meloidogyne graminicola]
MAFKLIVNIGQIGNGKEKDDTVIFNISSRGIGRWTGIGFSKDGKMTGSDIITGWFYDQKPYLTDRFAFAQQQPAIDPADRQDIFDIGGALNDDIQTISFRRKVVSLDKSTDLSLAQCVHFLFPVQGGRVLARSSKDFQQSRTPIGFHDQQQPISSTSKICLCDRPINFKNSENEKMGRRQVREVLNDKNREEEENEKVNNELPPYQCADVTIIQVMENHKNQKNLLIRAIDAFGLSNDSLKEDEHWGGKQSFTEVELVNNNGKNIIWLTKLLKVFLSTGHGIKPEISKAEKLEFALIDLLASSLQKEIIETSTLTNFTTSLSIPTTLEIKNITEQIEIISSSSDSPLQQKVKEASSEMENSEEKEEGEKEELEQHNEGNKEEENEEEETSQLPSDISKTSILTDENCFGGFAYPEDCMQLNSKQCQYMLQWMVIPELFKVNFQLNIQMPANHWTGIGFSKDGSMVNSDSIIAILEKDGKITVQDYFSINYEKPLLDSKQNIEQIYFNSIDGFWALNFSRSLFTNDVQDADLRLCQHFIFLNSPNPLNNGEIKKHIKIPKISENLICLGKCGQKTSSTQGDLLEELTTTTTMLETTLETLKEIEKQTEITQTLILETTTERETTEKTLETTQTLEKEKETTTEKETKEEKITEKITTTTNTISSTSLTTNKDEEQIKNNLIEESLIIKNEQKYKKKIFNVAIKLPNEEWNNKLGEIDSEEFNLMAEKLRNSLSSLISIKWPSLEMINVQKFAEGSVLALLQMTFNTTIKNIEDLPTSKQLKHFLKEAAAQKMPEELILDSEMLEVQENEEEGGGGFNDNNEIGGEEKEKIASIGQWQGWILAILGTFLLLSIATALLFCAFRNRKGNNLFFNGQISTNNNYQQSNHLHYTPFPGEKEDRQSENSTSNKTNNSECCNNNVKIRNKIIETPRGIGEASYREWFKKVASKDTPTHYQENYWQIPPPTPLPRSNNHGGLGGGGGGQQTPTIYGHSASPYLSYPNDPTYYTLNGEHKIIKYNAFNILGKLNHFRKFEEIIIKIKL